MSFSVDKFMIDTQTDRHKDKHKDAVNENIQSKGQNW